VRATEEALAAGEGVLAALREVVGERLEDLRRTAPRRIAARVRPDRIVGALETLRDALGWRHLSALHAVDTGDGLEILYHVSAPAGVLVSLRVALDRDDPRVPTVSGVHAVATLYEREVRDLFGVTFEGHPDPRRLLLYEGWPEGDYPLRKDWKPPEGGEKRAGG
jgi:NADH:ubiquinone oxidoreductase subunit C